MTEQEFKSRVKKVQEHRVHRVTNSYGMKEACYYYKSHCGKVEESTFRKIIKLINLSLQEQLANGEDIHFPKRMGFLELRKFKTKTEFIDGKLKTNLPIDWDATTKLWYEDEEARRRKQKVRIETPEIFRVFYKKTTANYNNKMYFQFITNRTLKLMLKRNITEGKIDAFSISK